MNPHDSHIARSTQNGARFQMRVVRKGATRARLSRRIGASQTTQFNTLTIPVLHSNDWFGLRRACILSVSVTQDRSLTPDPCSYGIFAMGSSMIGFRLPFFTEYAQRPWKLARIPGCAFRKALRTAIASVRRAAGSVTPVES